MKTKDQFLGNLIGFIIAVFGSSLERSKRQDYNTEQYDSVVGAYLAECTFYGDYTCDCKGRLTCRPGDVEERPTTAMLDRTCPQTSGTKTGKWERDQVVLSSAISRDAGSGLICKCRFHAKGGTGNFKCTSASGDTWKGTYTGSLNTAFRLGLSQSSSSNNYDRYGTNSGRGVTGDDDYRGSGSGSGRDYTRDRDRNTDRNDYSGGGFSTNIGNNDRDSNYRDNDAIGTGSRDRYQTSYGGTDNYDRDRENRYPTRARSSEIVMCTYMNDGKGTCRDCTERVDRKESASEIRTTKHYTCTGAQTKTTWSENNGIMPSGQRPDTQAYTKKTIATCIYRPEDGKTFECHGGSKDGACGASGDGYGSSGSTLYGTGSGYGNDGTTPQRCLSGEKWTGTYRGSIY